MSEIKDSRQFEVALNVEGGAPPVQVTADNYSTQEGGLNFFCKHPETTAKVESGPSVIVATFAAGTWAHVREVERGGLDVFAWVKEHLWLQYKIKPEFPGPFTRGWTGCLETLYGSITGKSPLDDWKREQEGA